MMLISDPLGRRLEKIELDSVRCLIVGASADNLLASGTQHNGVLELSGVAALDVTQWRVRIYDLLVAQILQSHLVLALAQAVQPPLAEGQRAEVLLDHVQQWFRRRQTENRIMPRLAEVAHKNWAITN